MAQKTTISDLEYILSFQQAELRYERKKLAEREQEVYEREVNVDYAQRDLEERKMILKWWEKTDE